MLKETKIFKFYDQVKQEVHKVTWPVKKELLTSTIIVIAAVFISSIVCAMLDYGIHAFVRLLLSL